MFLYNRVSDLFRKRNNSDSVSKGDRLVREAGPESEDETLKAMKDTLALKKDIIDTKERVIATRDGTFVNDDGELVLDKQSLGVRKRGNKPKKKKGHILKDLALVSATHNRSVSDSKPDKTEPENRTLSIIDVEDEKKVLPFGEKRSASRETLTLNIESPMLKRVPPIVSFPKKSSPNMIHSPFEKPITAKIELALAQGSLNEQEDPDQTQKHKKKRSKKKNKKFNTDLGSDPIMIKNQPDAHRKDKMYIKNLHMVDKNESFMFRDEPIAPVQKTSTLERKQLGDKLGVGSELLKDIEYVVYMTENEVDVNVRHVREVEVQPKHTENTDSDRTITPTHNEHDHEKQPKGKHVESTGNPTEHTNIYNLDTIDVKQKTHEINRDGAKTDRSIHQQTLDATLNEPNLKTREHYIVTEETVVTKKILHLNKNLEKDGENDVLDILNNQYDISNPLTTFITDLSVNLDDDMHHLDDKVKGENASGKTMCDTVKHEDKTEKDEELSRIQPGTRTISLNKYDDYSTRALSEFYDNRKKDADTPVDIPSAQVDKDLIGTHSHCEKRYVEFPMSYSDTLMHSSDFLYIDDDDSSDEDINKNTQNTSLDHNKLIPIVLNRNESPHDDYLKRSDNINQCIPDTINTEIDNSSNKMQIINHQEPHQYSNNEEICDELPINLDITSYKNVLQYEDQYNYEPLGMSKDQEKMSANATSIRENTTEQNILRVSHTADQITYDGMFIREKNIENNKTLEDQIRSHEIVAQQTVEDDKDSSNHRAEGEEMNQHDHENVAEQTVEDVKDSDNHGEGDEEIQK